MKFFNNNHRMKNQNGLATMIALVMMILLTMIGISALMVADDEISIASNESGEMAAFYAAEAGLEAAAASIQSQYESTGAPPTTMPSGSETLGHSVVAYNTVDNGAAVTRPLTLGTLAGLNAIIKTYTITSTGTNQTNESQIQLEQDFECALVPIFQFAVFYGNDLEIAPGPDMTLIGRVHSNGNLWLQAGSNLYMESFVTCSGDLIHGRKGPGSVDNGDVWIKDTEGNYQNMKNADGTFLQSSTTGWYDTASSRWDGRVQDAAFGQEDLNLPLANSTGDPHKLIERTVDLDGDANPDSYETKADLKIINGAVLAKIGTVWTDITSLLPSGTVTQNKFYDHRENDTVYSTDVDMQKLSGSTYFPSNGVVYASDRRAGTFNGLRLVNGSSVGQPVSVFSENPMYVKGDFNNVNKQPVALCADAVTFLSNNWVDSNSYSGNLGDRVATDTECNASVMTGNVETTSSDYNGGLENLPRFLEDWSAAPKKTFTFKGSLVNLWNSVQAIGDWSYGSPKYTAPIRNWAYDTDLDDPTKLPPETPKALVFHRTGWRQQYVGYASSHDST